TTLAVLTALLTGGVGVSSRAGAGAVAPAASAQSNQVVIFGYGGIFDQAIPSFEAQTGMKVVTIPWASEADAVTKLRVNPTGIDVVTFSSAPSFDQLRSLNLLQPIDLSRVSNWRNVQPALRENLPFSRSDGVIDHVPFDWGATGLLWDVNHT